MIRDSHWTRRNFVKQVASAPIAAPLIISPSALGGPGKTPPSERINLGMIGMGGFGHAHLGIGNRPDCEIRAICDVNADRIWEFSLNKNIDIYRDFRELLARDDIDAVIISTPDHWHAIHAIEAAKAGKDMYVEKPISLTVREARAMVDAVRRYGRVFQTGTQQRSSHKARFACEMVRNGRIGELKSIEVYVGGPSRDCRLPAQPVAPGVDWDMWLGPAPWRPFNSQLLYHHWLQYYDYSGGGMTDIGAHHFDLAQWAMGTEHTGPVEVIPPDGKDVRWLTFRYDNGVVMTHNGPGGHGVVFKGTEGKIEVEFGHLKTWPDHLMRTPTQPNEMHLYRSSSHHANWLECIRTRRKPVADVEAGCRSVTICHLANIAYWLGRQKPLRWDPEKEEFIGDPEANRWLERPMRAPWSIS